jgi:hypothetical protein
MASTVIYAMCLLQYRVYISLTARMSYRQRLRVLALLPVLYHYMYSTPTSEDTVQYSTKVDTVVYEALDPLLPY